MSRIQTALVAAREAGRTGLIPYLCAGDPSLEVTALLVPRLEEAGADVVELGIPFSDPVADGPVIQAASGRALEGGATVGRILDLVRSLRHAGCSVPVALMTYLNPVLAFGAERFFARAAEAGVDGLIVPDLPLEESDALSRLAGASGIDLVLLAAPTTPPERLTRIAAASRGFLYFVSVTGVTGGQGALPAELPSQLAAARAASSLPVAVGFGVSTPEQARVLGAQADAVVVGSALVRALQEGGPEKAVALVASLAAALRSRG